MTTDTLSSPRPYWQTFSQALRLGALSFILTLFCLSLIAADGQLSPIWFPTTLITVVVFRASSRAIPWLVLGCMAGLLLASAIIIAPSITSLKYAAVNLLQGLAGGYLLRLLLNRNAPLNSLLNWSKMAVAVGLFTPLLGALLALWWLPKSGSGALSFFNTWVIAEIIGMLALGPVCLLWQPDDVKAKVRQTLLLETLLTLLITLTLCFCALRFLPWPYTFVIVILFWSAIRLPRLEALVVFLATIAMMALMLVHGLMPMPPPVHTSSRLWLAPWLPFLLVLLPGHIMAQVMHSFREERKHISESEARFRNAMEYSAIGMALVSPSGVWLQANQALCRLLGYRQDELRDLTFQQITHPDDLYVDLQQLEALLAGEINSYTLEKRYLHKEGQVVWALLAVSLVRDAEHQPLYFISQIEDITELKQTEDVNRKLMERITLTNEALFQEKERMLITLDSIGEAVISTDEDLRVTFMNPVAEKMSGWTQRHAAGKPLREILHITQGREGPEMENLLLCALPESKTSPNLDRDLVLHNHVGEQFDIHYSITPLKTLAGDNIGSVMVIQDVSESREMMKHLSYSASHDMLTRLPNRVNFEHQLKRLLHSANELAHQHLLAFIDLDRFKAVNDTAGHAAGDALLRDLAELMQRSLRSSDFLARLGGDEFGLLLPDCDIDNGREIVQRIVNAINDFRFLWEGRLYRIGASAGLTCIHHDNSSASEVMAQADLACYNAKHSGRGQLAFYEARLQSDKHAQTNQQESEKIIQENPLRLVAWAVAPPRKTQAISFYLLDAQSHTHDGVLVEATALRASLQDDSALILLDRKLLETFFNDYAADIARKGLTVALPLSTAALRDKNFVDQLCQNIAAHALPASQLLFSVDSEAVLTQHPDLRYHYRRLQALGCRLILRECGRNLDIFQQLHSGDIDYLLFSADLVANVHCNLMDEMLVSIIHGHASRLNIATIAGPIELPIALTTLAAIGVDGAWGEAIASREALRPLLSNGYFAIK
ncbi:Diguanylate cyclase/phosphodiesterase [Paramixta manurensis]|uniref:diguanylate cyclase n=1 Tax=Paramixta manurensis TaxID=2740817 RepID=A0A6M8UHB6_9GAMM|nr:Diguanylate cyclase/phosphodiesterase [Erwiniaceae bacterium PD-1]